MIEIVPARGVLRVLRGGALAVCSTVLAVAAHAAVGGGVPDAGLALLVMVLLTAAGVGLARRRRSLPGILGVLTVTQVVLHFLLSIADMHAVPERTMFSVGWGMLAAHAVAVLVTSLMLTSAEAAVFGVAAALARLVPRLAVFFVPAESPGDPVIAAERVDRLVHVLLCRVCPLRGPPVRF